MCVCFVDFPPCEFDVSLWLGSRVASLMSSQKCHIPWCVIWGGISCQWVEISLWPVVTLACWVSWYLQDLSTKNLWFLPVNHFLLLPLPSCPLTVLACGNLYCAGYKLWFCVSAIPPTPVYLCSLGRNFPSPRTHSEFRGSYFMLWVINHYCHPFGCSDCSRLECWETFNVSCVL